MSHSPRGWEVSLTKTLALEHVRCGIVVKGAVAVMRPAARGVPVGM